MRAYGSANEYGVETSRWINNLLGGTDVKPGGANAINNPAGIEHLINSYGGGAFAFWTDLASLAMTLTTDEYATTSDIMRQVPIQSRFYKGSIDRYMEQDAMETYYQAVENLQILNNRKRNLPIADRVEYEAAIAPLSDKLNAYTEKIEAAEKTRDLDIEASKSFAEKKKIRNDYRNAFLNIMQDFETLENDINQTMKEY